MTKSNVLSVFGGRLIRIYTDDFKRIMDEKGNVHELPITVEGYLIDEDDEYYFLSYDLSPDLISQSIKKKKASIIEDIEILEQTNETISEQSAIEEAMAEKSKKHQLN